MTDEQKKNNSLLDRLIIYMGTSDDLIFWVLTDVLYLSTVKGFTGVEISMVFTGAFWGSLILSFPYFLFIKKIKTQTAMVITQALFIVASFMLFISQSVATVMIAQSIYFLAADSFNIGDILMHDLCRKSDGRRDFVKCRSQRATIYGILSLAFAFLIYPLMQVDGSLPMLIQICMTVGSLVLVVLIARDSRDMVPYTKGAPIIQDSKAPETQPPTVSSTDSSTGSSKNSSTDSNANSATDSSTDSATDSSSGSATGSSTDSATGSSTGSATDSSSGSATGSSTDSATGSSTDSNTNSSTGNTPAEVMPARKLLDIGDITYSKITWTYIALAILAGTLLTVFMTNGKILLHDDIAIIYGADRTVAIFSGVIIATRVTKTIGNVIPRIVHKKIKKYQGIAVAVVGILLIAMALILLSFSLPQASPVLVGIGIAIVCMAYDPIYNTTRYLFLNGLSGQQELSAIYIVNLLGNILNAVLSSIITLLLVSGTMLDVMQLLTFVAILTLLISILGLCLYRRAKKL